MKPILKFALLGAFHAVGVDAFQNPIRNPGPDPSMVYADGYYHL